MPLQAVLRYLGSGMVARGGQGVDAARRLSNGQASTSRQGPLSPAGYAGAPGWPPP